MAFLLDISHNRWFCELRLAGLSVTDCLYEIPQNLQFSIPGLWKKAIPLLIPLPEMILLIESSNHVPSQPCHSLNQCLHGHVEWILYRLQLCPWIRVHYPRDKTNHFLPHWFHFLGWDQAKPVLDARILLPYVVLGEEIAKQMDLQNQEPKIASTVGAGGIMSLHNSSISLPQILSAAMCSGVFELMTKHEKAYATAWALRVSTFGAVAAAVSTISFMHFSHTK